VYEDIMRVLQSNFVFKGIRTALLTQVAQRMVREEFQDGQVIVQQGDKAAPGDKMYYIQVRC
jgi:CRP-like cAMP-binding protein